MPTHHVKKGLDLPLAGEPSQSIERAEPARRVALLGADHPGLRARLAVEEGTRLARGDLVFEDRTRPGVRFTAPAAGRVSAIHRGARRALQSVVIDVDGDEPRRFESFPAGGATKPDEVRALLLESGLWTALRTRPFGRIPAPTDRPQAVFVTAMDSHPHAPSPDVVLAGHEERFVRGLHAVATLTEGPTYLCKGAGSTVDGGDAPVQTEVFAGVHPAGTPGLHIHVLDPVHRDKTVWHLGYQDVLAMGHLVAEGTLDPRRVVSLGGPAVERPRLLETCLGASVDELVDGELVEGDVRVISGSAIFGRIARGAATGYLGRYATQVCALVEGRSRKFFGWIAPGTDDFSILPVFLSRILGRKRFALDTNRRGARRAIVPIGMYERVMPMDILPTHLLRALMAEDLAWAEELGCLELDEEDLALCTFVCPGKADYGAQLRRVLDRIEKEGA